jgi:sugar diacid utilization regulator
MVWTLEGRQARTREHGARRASKDDDGEPPTIDAQRAAIQYVSLLCEEIVDYARLDETACGALKAHAERTIALLIAAFAESRPHTDAEVAELESIGAAQADLGTSSRAVFDATRLGRRRFLQGVEAHLASHARDPRLALSVLRQAVEQYDATATAVVEGYRRRETSSQTPSRTSARMRLVETLLSAEAGPTPDVVSRARSCGWDLIVPHGLLLVTPHSSSPDPEACLGRFMAAYVASRPEAVDSPMRSRPVVHGTLLVPARSSAAWTQAIAVASRLASTHGVVVVPSGTTCEAAHIGTAYEDVVSYLELATRVADAPCVLNAEKLVVYRMVAEWSPAVESSFMSGGVGRFLDLPEGRRTRLAAAIWALFLCDESYTAAAERLSMTPKAVRKRMETLHTLTGLSFGRAQDRLQLWLILHLLKLRGGSTREKDPAANFPARKMPLVPIDASGPLAYASSTNSRRWGTI